MITNIPQGDLEALAKAHAEAVDRNEAAKVRLQRLNEYGQELKFHVLHPSSSSKEPSLISHLENVRLQQEHEQLQTLSHYVLKAQKIADDDGIYEDLPLLLPSKQDAHHEDPSYRRAQAEVDDMLTETTRLTTDLELALVQARQRLKLERALLGELDDLTKSKPGEESRIDDRVKLRALEATRDELQRWIEETLAQCENDDEEDWQSGESALHTSVNQQDQIDNAYESYLGRRRDLIDLVRGLEQPTPSATGNAARPQARSTPSAERHTRHLQPAPQLRSYRRSSAHFNAMSGPSLAQIQSTSMPLYLHEKLLSSYLSHLIEQMDTQDRSLLQSLHRLSHESHLLPSHPNPRPREKTSPGLSRQQGEADQLLQSWAFASNAAEKIQDRNVEDHTIEATAALEEADGDIRDLLAMESMRRQVTQIDRRGST